MELRRTNSAPHHTVAVVINIAAVPSAAAISAYGVCTSGSLGTRNLSAALCSGSKGRHMLMRLPKKIFSSDRFKLSQFAGTIQRVITVEWRAVSFAGSAPAALSLTQKLFGM